MSIGDIIFLIILACLFLHIIALLISMFFCHFAFKAADKEDYKKAIKLTKISDSVLLICTPLFFLLLKESSEELIKLYQENDRLNKLKEELHDINQNYTKYAGDDAEEL